MVEAFQLGRRSLLLAGRCAHRKRCPSQQLAPTRCVTDVTCFTSGPLLSRKTMLRKSLGAGLIAIAVLTNRGPLRETSARAEPSAHSPVAPLSSDPSASADQSKVITEFARPLGSRYAGPIFNHANRLEALPCCGYVIELRDREPGPTSDLCGG